jgi:DNA repair protein RadD
MNYNQDEIISSLSKMFQEFSDPKRKKLIGTKIDSIISKYFDKISPEQLSLALISKYGSSLFDPKHGILETIIEGSDSGELFTLCQTFNIKNYDDPHDELLSIAKNKSNLKKFLQHYDLPDYFLIESPRDEREASQIVNIEYGEELKSLGYPHSYQNNIKLEILNRLEISSGKFSCLAVMPTGSGKTRTAIEFMIDFIRRKKNANIVWIVDSPELSEQALQNFIELWKLRGDRELKTYRCFNKLNPTIQFDRGCNVIFTAFDKMMAEKDKSTDLYDGIKNKTELLIIDEAHYSLAEKYNGILSDIRNNSSDQLITLGLTATPMRPDDNEFFGIKTFFQNNITPFKDENGNEIQDPLNYLQENNYLAEIEVEYLKIPKNEINETSREFNNKVIERIKISVGEGKQIIIFAASKDHAIALNILLRNENILSNCIVGETLPQERQILFKQFKNKEINVLINFDILSTGIDLPKVDELFLLRKFGQYTTAMQVLGRALRGELNGGNKKNRVISIINNETMIEDANDLFNLIKNMY